MAGVLFNYRRYPEQTRSFPTPSQRDAADVALILRRKAVGCPAEFRSARAAVRAIGMRHV